MAFRVFHWRTLGAVRGAEGTAAALPRGGGSQLSARSGGGSTVPSLHSAESELPSVVVSDPESGEPPVTVSESVKTSEPGRKSGRRWRRGGQRSVCARRVFGGAPCFSPPPGKVLIPRTVTRRGAREAAKPGTEHDERDHGLFSAPACSGGGGDGHER